MAWIPLAVRVIPEMTVVAGTYFPFQNWYTGHLRGQGLNIDQPGTQVRINAISAAVTGVASAPFGTLRFFVSKVEAENPNVTMSQSTKVALLNMFKHPIRSSIVTALMTPVTVIPMTLIVGGATAAYEYGGSDHSNKPRPA